MQKVDVSVQVRLYQAYARHPRGRDRPVPRLSGRHEPLAARPEITVGISEISGGPKIDFGGFSVVFGAAREPHITPLSTPRDSEVSLVAVFGLAVLSASGGARPPEFR